MALDMHPSLAVSVGGWIRTELVEPHSLKIKDLAEHFRVSRQALSALLNGRTHLSADMAIRFEKAFGVKADTLMRMQMAWNMTHGHTLDDGFCSITGDGK
ncbi:HigA family addiction module antitoxin [Komagataeibacter sp. FNDCR2]|uniref:HigA family addiction module antitoxin n=1 Tax=Komagataeibacter sp. FNDCR2 TaxID=2878682 RepID=UPI00351D93D9